MITALRRYRWLVIGRKKIRKLINQAWKEGFLKIDIGSGKIGEMENGWVKTDIPHFDALKKSDWEHFLADKKIDQLFSEHVLEHLTDIQNNELAKLTFHYLKPGGVFRIAVPDGYHKNPDYIEYVKPGGSGLGADDHKVLWNIDTLSAVYRNVGFLVTGREYYDKEGNLHTEDLDPGLGVVLRKYGNEETANATGIPDFSSLIIDVVKK